jgi:hypothetical protein
MCDLALLFWCEFLGCVLRERSLDHLLHSQCLDSKQIEDHIVCQPELRSQSIRCAQHHLIQLSSLAAASAEGRSVQTAAYRW